MSSWLKGALALACYDLWLLSFPLEGNLALVYGNFNINYFLIPHIIGLLFFTLFLKTFVHDRVMKLGTFLLIFCTNLYPIFDNKSLCLVFIGLLSSVTLVRTLAIINFQENKTLAIGSGLAIGNLFVFILYNLPFAILYKFLIVSFSLIPIILFPAKISENSKLKDFKIYLPFIFVFYVLGGIFYGFLINEYMKSAFFNGLELIFYVLFSLVCIYLIKRDIELILALSILLGMLSFSLLKAEHSFLINLSMFMMQSSFALMDFLLIFLIVNSGCSLKSIGYGIGVMCFALIVGNALSNHFSIVTKYLLSIGNVILTISVLLFYFLGRRLGISDNKSLPNENTGNSETFYVQTDFNEEKTNISSKIEKIIFSTQKRFSPKEIEVLKLIIQKRTYKEIAQKLEISESSVKTYVRRISDKLNVHGKDGIIKVFDEFNDEFNKD